MTVSTFDPNRISVTPSAQDHIAKQIEKSGGRCLRLGIKESGCNGYMYTLDYIDQPAPADHEFSIREGLNLYVSESDLPLVRGTEVDFVVEGLNGSLKFNNPNAASHCGCGESFSLQPGN